MAVSRTAATENPAVAVMRTPPAIRVAAAGRACAKRMKTPYQCCSLLLRNELYSVWSDTADAVRLPRAIHLPFNTGRTVPRHLPSYPIDGNVITSTRNRLTAPVGRSDALLVAVQTSCSPTLLAGMIALSVCWFAQSRRTSYALGDARDTERVASGP